METIEPKWGPWDREYCYQSHLVQSDIIDTESPLDVHDVVDGLLIELEGQKNLRHRGTGLDLVDMSHLPKLKHMDLNDLGLNGAYTLRCHTQQGPRCQ